MRWEKDLDHLRTAQDGAVLVEYGLMVLLIAAALLTIVKVLAAEVAPLFTLP